MLIIVFVLVFGLSPTMALAKDGSGPGASAGGGNSGNGGGAGAGNGVGGGDGGGHGGGGGNGGGGGAGNGGGGNAGGGGGTGGSGGGGSAGGGGGTGGSGGGAAGGSSAGAGGGTGGSGGTGDSGGGAGGGISSTSVSGAPRDDVNVAIAATNINALGFRLVRYARQGTALLRPNQEWTHDVFTFCKPGDASLTVLRPDGSFSFDAIDSVAARSLMRCMAQYGFAFDGVSGESANFGVR